MLSTNTGYAETNALLAILEEQPGEAERIVREECGNVGELDTLIYAADDLANMARRIRGEVVYRQGLAAQGIEAGRG